MQQTTYNPYQFELTEKTRERLLNNEVVEVEINEYLTIKMMRNTVELYTMNEMINRLRTAPQKGSRWGSYKDDLGDGKLEQ